MGLILVSVAYPLLVGQQVASKISAAYLEASPRQTGQPDRPKQYRASDLVGKNSAALSVVKKLDYPMLPVRILGEKRSGASGHAADKCGFVGSEPTTTGRETLEHGRTLAGQQNWTSHSHLYRIALSFIFALASPDTDSNV